MIFCCSLRGWAEALIGDLLSAITYALRPRNRKRAWWSNDHHHKRPLIQYVPRLIDRQTITNSETFDCWISRRRLIRKLCEEWKSTHVATAFKRGFIRSCASCNGIHNENLGFVFHLAWEAFSVAVFSFCFPRSFSMFCLSAARSLDFEF